MTVLSTRTRPTPKHTVLILELALGAWGVLLVVGYFGGVGFLTLLDIVGAWL
jgi:hypothetical protein